MVAEIRLGGRGVQRLRQLLTLLQALRQLQAADGAVLFVVFPAGAGDISPHDALNGDHGELLTEGGSALKLLVPEEFRHVLGIYGYQIVRDHILGEIEPELGHLCQDLALVGDLVVKNHVKSRNSVCCYHQQVLAEIVDLTNLAFLYRLKFGHWYTSSLFSSVNTPTINHFPDFTIGKLPKFAKKGHCMEFCS